MNKFLLLSICLITVLFVSCDKIKVQTLEEFMTAQTLSPSDDLVACAASTLVLSMDFPPVHTMVYYKTVEGQGDIKVWYSEAFSQDFSKYQEITVNDVRIHNNFMGSALMNLQSGSIIVSTSTEDEFIYSKPIEILSDEITTVIHTDVEVDLANGLNPFFTWPESTVDSESIYFHLIVDMVNDDAITGTYSYENTFTFYDLNNVVFNVTEKENPELLSNTNYLMQVMHVSDNNYVTKITRAEFTTP